jgi:hypothetical protein
VSLYNWSLQVLLACRNYVRESDRNVTCKAVIHQNVENHINCTITNSKYYKDHNVDTYLMFYPIFLCCLSTLVLWLLVIQACYYLLSYILPLRSSCTNYLKKKVCMRGWTSLSLFFFWWRWKQYHLSMSVWVKKRSLPFLISIFWHYHMLIDFDEFYLRSKCGSLINSSLGQYVLHSLLYPLFFCNISHAPLQKNLCHFN